MLTAQCGDEYVWSSPFAASVDEYLQDAGAEAFNKFQRCGSGSCSAVRSLVTSCGPLQINQCTRQRGRSFAHPAPKLTNSKPTFSFETLPMPLDSSEARSPSYPPRFDFANESPSYSSFAEKTQQTYSPARSPISSATRPPLTSFWEVVSQRNRGARGLISTFRVPSLPKTWIQRGSPTC